MNWNVLESDEQLEKLLVSSEPQLVFKHSTRCPVSFAALKRFELEWDEEINKSVNPCFLDLITYRNLSNKIEEVLGVKHQSPQIILLKNGEVLFHTSHLSISAKKLLTHI